MLDLCFYSYYHHYNLNPAILKPRFPYYYVNKNAHGKSDKIYSQ